MLVQNMLISEKSQALWICGKQCPHCRDCYVALFLWGTICVLANKCLPEVRFWKDKSVARIYQDITSELKDAMYYECLYLTINFLVPFFAKNWKKHCLFRCTGYLRICGMCILPFLTIGKFMNTRPKRIEIGMFHCICCRRTLFGFILKTNIWHTQKTQHT